VEVEAKGFPKTDGLFFVAVGEISVHLSEQTGSETHPAVSYGRQRALTYLGVKRPELEPGNPFKSE